MSFDFNDLGSLSDPENRVVNVKGAMEIQIELIDEDPNQPRTDFNPETLNELAETIKDRGVKSPISVHRLENGRYMVNHGARRLRACKIAGKTTIPAFIDDDYSKIDQIIENIQRDELKPMEIARFIQSEKERGLTQKQIAVELGKGATWVSNILELLNLCPALQVLYDNNKVDNYITVTELNRLYKQDPNKVNAFIEEATDVITRKDVRDLATIIRNSSAFEDFSAVKDDISANQSYVDESIEVGAESADDSSGDEQMTAPSETTPTTDTNAEAQPEDMHDLSDLDETANEPNESTDLFKTVKEIRCVCDDFGEVTVVFREAEHEDHAVVLTSDGVKEVETTSLKLLRVVF